MKKKKYTKDFKARVALEAIKGQRTVNELSHEFGVHANQISKWKKLLLESASEVFGTGNGRRVEQIEAERDCLYRKVGQLQIEVDWLKKKTGYLD